MQVTKETQTKRTQEEILSLIINYNSTDRTIIKDNLKRIMANRNIKPADIMSLGYATNNVYSWTSKTSPNIPMFDQALSIAVNFGFDVEELLKI